MIVLVRALFVVQATDIAGVYDDLSNRALDLALTRNLWRVRANRLSEGITKPTMQQIHCLLEEVFLPLASKCIMRAEMKLLFSSAFYLVFLIGDVGMLE